MTDDTQARRKRPWVRRLPVWAWGLILAGGVALLVWLLVGRRVSEVTLAPVTRGRAVAAVYAPGTVKSGSETVVSAPVAGRLVGLNVSLGTQVSPGAVIARLDDAQARLQVSQTQDQVRQMQEQVRQAQAQVRQAQAQQRQAEEAAGQAQAGVRAAQARVRTARSNVAAAIAQQRAAAQQIEGARARVAGAQAALTNARDALGRTQRLYAEGAVAQRQVVEAQAAVNTAQAELEGAQAGVNQAQDGAAAAQEAVGTAQAQVGEAESAVEQAQAGGAQAQAGVSNAQAAVDAAQTQVAAARTQVSAAQTQVAQAQEALSRYTVRTLVGGTVSQVPANVGDYLMTGAPIATVVRTGELYVQADVDESDIGPIAIGQPAFFTSDAVPDRTYEGRVAQVGASANQQTSTYPVEVRSIIDRTGLRVGMSVDVNVVTRQNPDALLVPSAAVVLEPTPHVWQVERDRLRERPVTIGARDTASGRTEIISGLAEGDLVVTDPQSNFRNGQRVRTANSE